MSRTGDGRSWAYAGAALGGVVSTAANIAHSYVTPSAERLKALGVTAREWSPQPGAVLGAVFWPVALFIAAEILARIDWPAGRRWLLLRYLGLLPVALVAAVVSYRHLSGLLRFYGEDTLTATIGPLAVDGLMTMATAALMASAHGRTAAVLATVTDTRPPAGTATDSTAGPVSDPMPRQPAAVRSLRLPASMRDAVTERARQVAAEGRALTAEDVRQVIRVSEDLAGQIVRELDAA